MTVNRPKSHDFGYSLAAASLAGYASELTRQDTESAF